MFISLSTLVRVTYFDFMEELTGQEGDNSRAPTDRFHLHSLDRSGSNCLSFKRKGDSQRRQVGQLFSMPVPTRSLSLVIMHSILSY